MERQTLLCAVLVLALAATGAVTAQPTPAATPPAAFGTTPADVTGAQELTDSLSVAGIESGTSTAPQPVQQAFLASVTGNSSIVEGSQTVSGLKYVTRPSMLMLMPAHADACSC